MTKEQVIDNCKYKQIAEKDTVGKTIAKILPGNDAGYENVIVFTDNTFICFDELNPYGFNRSINFYYKLGFITDGLYQKYQREIEANNNLSERQRRHRLYLKLKKEFEHETRR